MALIRFDNLGAIGIIKDLPDHELPPEAWSDGKNVRFHDGKVEKFTGHQAVYNLSASITTNIAIAPWWLLPVQSGTNYYWLYAGRQHVYAAAPNLPNNKITRVSGTVSLTSTDALYSATANIRWNGGMLAGIAVINNGIDAPQMWNPVGLSDRLKNLTYDTSAGTTWATAAVTARCLRPFKNFLVAMDVTKSGVRYPHMVKWSHPADPGAVPVSWDEANTTKDAGENDLAGSEGYVLDCLPLRDINVVYKEDATWGMQYVGGSFIFRFHQIFTTTGALSRDCAVEVLGRHIVLADGDVLQHDGQSAESIIDKKWRKWLFANIDTNYYENCFVARNYLKNEVWICFPETGATIPFPTKALVWNWKENSFTVRELPQVAHIAAGLVQPNVTTRTWAGMAGTTWAAITGAWGQRGYNPTTDSLLMARPEPDSATAAPVSKLLQPDQTEQFDGVNMTAYVERLGLGIGGMDRYKNPKVDMENMKFLRAIWPRIEATTGTKINIYGAAQAYPGATVTYDGPHTFTVGEALKVDLRQSGRLVGAKFETNTNVSWKLTGYDLDIDVVGRF